MNNKEIVSWNQALALMVVIFAILGLALSQLNMIKSFDAWMVLLFLSAAIGLVFRIYPRRKVNSSGNLISAADGAAKFDRNLHSRLIRVAKLLPFLVLVPGLYSSLNSVRLQLSVHGYLHLGYIYQLLNGHTPPENPLLPGYPANYYWYYHALLATLSQAFHTAPPLVSAVLSFAILAISLGLLKELIGYLLTDEQRPSVLMLLAFFGLFGMNLLGTIYAIMRISPEVQTFRAFMRAIDPQPLLGDPRLNVLLNKYLGFNGVAEGILTYILVLLIVIRALSGDIRRSDFVLGILATFAALALHSIDAVFIVVAVPTALFATYLFDAYFKRELLNIAYHKQQASTLMQSAAAEWQWTLVTIAIIAILSIAALRFLLGASSGYPISIEVFAPNSLKGIISMTLPLIGFFFLGAYFGFKKADRRLIFLVVLTIVGMAMGYALRFMNNEYKFIYLATISMCIVCVVPIWRYVFGPAEQRFLSGRLIGIVMLLLMLVNVFAKGFSQIVHPMVNSDNFVYRDTHIDSHTAYVGTPEAEVEIPWAFDGAGNPYLSDLQYADIYQWARENTPTDAILVVPLTHRDVSSLYALSERLPYVVDGDQMNRLLPDYDQRVKQVQDIYNSNGLDKEIMPALVKIRESLEDREKYLIYPSPDKELAFDPAELGMELVYVGRHGNLYLITPG